MLKLDGHLCVGKHPRGLLLTHGRHISRSNSVPGGIPGGGGAADFHLLVCLEKKIMCAVHFCIYFMNHNKMTTLCQLAAKYGVDKCPAIGHTYTPHYNALFTLSRDSIKKVVEIGIGNVPLMKPIVGASYKPGASLRMWRDYFPGAQVIGCDILPEVIFNDEERIRTHIVDQSNKESLLAFKSIIGNPDLILDDGSHIESHMKLSFEILWDAVKVDGIYIIEDVQSHFLSEIVNLAKNLGFDDAELVYVHKGKSSWDNFVAFKKIK